uniref:Alpha-1,4-N-acetylglucosaminyltransferase n=1 Tax=Anopheles maculatus TaxID=74869 RepID=A0A182SZ85_9DIPT
MSPTWYRYLRYAVCAFLLFLLVRLIRHRKPKETYIPADIVKEDPGFLQSYDTATELHRYSSVFFIESSAPFKPIVTIEPRQACAIESAARANPHKKVIVLFASWNEFTNPNQVRFPDILTLVRLPNVHFRWLDLEHFAHGTPVEGVIRSDKLHQRRNGAEYLSEILRLVLLYKYGGIYLDLDVVTMKKLEFYNPNFFGAETPRLVGSSVIGLER